MTVTDQVGPASDFDSRKARARTYDEERAAIQRARNDRNATRTHTPFHASARRIDIANAASERNRIKRVTTPGSRETDAWVYYDVLSEVKESARFKERSLSKLALFPAVRLSATSDPVPVDTIDNDTDVAYVTDPLAVSLARSVYDRIDGGAGTGHLTGSWGSIGFVSGDSYLVGYPDPTMPTGERFVLVTADNMKVTDRDTWALALSPEAPAGDWIPLPEGESIITRIWNRHAHWPDLADSAVLGTLDLCEKILLLSNMEYGTATSHMNAGWVIFPKGILGQERQPDDNQTGEAITDLFRNPTAADLAESILTPIGDPRNVGVAAPGIMEADDKLIEKIRHMTFGRDFDATAADMLEKSIIRFANGVTLPREVVLGMTDATNWTAWMVDDQTWRAYLEPDAKEFVQAASGGTYRPLLMAQWAALGRDQAAPIGKGPDGRVLTVMDLCLGADASNLIGDPDADDNVFKAHDKLLIGSTPARRRLGYDESEAPTEEDIAQQIALQRGREAVGPGGEPLPTAGPDGAPADPGTLPDEAGKEGGAGEGGVTASARRANPFAGYGRKWAARDAALTTRLLAQADTAMSRALDRAGAKLRTKALRASPAHQGVVAAVASNRDVAAVLGPGVVATLGLSPDELLDGAFDEVTTRFRAGVGRAQAATLEDLRRAGLADDVADDLHDRQASARDVATTAFTAALVALAIDRIYNPHPAAPPAGEHDTELTVPTSLVRSAMTTAGGASGRQSAGGTVITGADETPVSGVALGGDVTDTVEGMGATIATWTWSYGDESTRTRGFDPHMELDGLEFTSWDDDALLVQGDWPVATHYFPGDHEGDQCQAYPDIVPAPGQEAPEGGE